MTVFKIGSPVLAEIAHEWLKLTVVDRNIKDGAVWYILEDQVYHQVFDTTADQVTAVVGSQMEEIP